MQGKRWLVLVAAALALGGGALRAESGAGHDRAPSGVLTLDAEVSAEIANDLALMTLFVEREAPNPAAAAEGVAQALDEAARQARAVPEVQVRTGGVGTLPQYDPKGKIVRWRARGELILESRDFPKLSVLGAQLNPLMQIAQVRFQLSPEARRREEARLIGAAIEAFRRKAVQAVEAFGYRGYTIREVNVSSGPGRGEPPVPYRAQALSVPAEATPVPLEGGRTEVAVSVRGSVQMER
ncbi:MAG: SIMPL domain-containing protein [Pseudomonadota bacterium]